MARNDVGSGLGIRPIKLDGPVVPDSEFDGTVRIPVKNTAYMRPRFAPSAPQVPGSALLQAAQQPTGLTASPVPSAALTPPATPTTPEPTPTPTPAPTPQPSPLPGYDPTQLNFEGSTFNPEAPATTTTNQFDQGAASRLLDELESFSGIKINPEWRYLPADQILKEVEAGILRAQSTGTLGNRPDDKFRIRLDDWLAKFRQTVKGVTSPNTDYQTQYLGQGIFNSAVQRLKYQGASDARAQDEEILSLLASRGLLNSGIAARELTRLRAEREKNLSDAAGRLNELLLQNELGRLTQRDLTTLQADLQKRNNEAYLRLQNRLIKENQPSPLAQIAGTAIGTGLPFLLGGKAPQARNAGEPGGAILTDDRQVSTRNA